MASQTASASTHLRRPWRSTGAVITGILVGAALSLGTDQVLHMFQVYPPWNRPMYDPGLNLLALAYRLPFAILGSYVIALLAPRNPMFHALVGGVVGFIVSGIGLIAATVIGGVGPLWYPAMLVVTALPCAWLGGVVYRIWHPES